MRKRRIIGACLAFASLFVALGCFFTYPKRQTSSNAAQKTVVRVWNVDTFEGGKGSRTSFLKKIAARVEKDELVYYMVENYTQTGVQAAFSEGIYPDILSFGIGLDGVAERCLPLPYEFIGGEVNGKTIAYPWCKGGYALFSLDSFEKEGKTAISCGGENLPQVAAALSQIEGDELDSLTAYTQFLSGEYAYLLGTQRDYCRFQARGVSVQVKPLDVFCDLYQYVAVLSLEKREACLDFLAELLSDETQKQLKNVGMYPIYGASDEFSAGTIEATCSVFTSQDALETLRECAREKVDEKKLRNFLKKI